MIKNILCYSHSNFDNIMQNNNWINSPGPNCSAISICSPNDIGFEHWFKDDCHGLLTSVFNLDIDDGGPFWFKEFASDNYDKSLKYFLKGNLKMSNAYFNYIDTYGTLIHVMDYEEAFNLVKWIDNRIRNFDSTIYIHCGAGVSRSQGVVRYILDTYGDEFDIHTNKNNPCLTPNSHVVMMLKRAYVHLLYNGYFDMLDNLNDGKSNYNRYVFK